MLVISIASAMEMLTWKCSSSAVMSARCPMESHCSIVSLEDASLRSWGLILNTLPTNSLTVMVYLVSSRCDPRRSLHLEAGEFVLPELMASIVALQGEAVLGVEVFHRMIFLGRDKFAK